MFLLTMQTMTELEFVDLVSCLMRVVWAAAAGKLYLASMGIQVSLPFPQPVLGIRIQIRRFFDLLDPDLDSLVRCGSGSFYHRAKIVRKTLVPSVTKFHALKCWMHSY
jgi:hypothetical protein